MNAKQKKKRSMNIDAIIANAARLNKKEAQAVVDYLESIKFADKKPPSSVVKTKLKGFVGGDEEKIKMLFKAPKPNELKAKEVKTEQISATQQYKAVKDMLKVPEDATVDQVVKAFSEKANCSEEQARNFIVDLRSEHASTDTYQTMLTMMKDGKKVGDSKPPEAIDDSGLDIDKVIVEQDKKILVEGKGDGDVSGRVDTEKIPKPKVSEEVEEIAPPEDDRETTVMPAPEIKEEKQIEQPLEPVSLKSIEDQAQEAEPPGKTRQVEAPKLDAPEKLPDGTGPLPRPEDLSQPAEPPGATQSVKAISPDILEINEKAETVKEILLVKGSKVSDITEERISGVTNTIIDEGIKRYAAELIQRGADRAAIKKKLVKKGVDELDADAALIVLDDEGIDRSSRISQIPVTSNDVIELRDPTSPPLRAPPPIKKTEEKEEKREITEELDAPDIEEMEPPKEKEEKKEKKEKSKPPPPPPKKKKTEEKEEEKSEETEEPEDKKEDGKDHGPLSTARTRKSVTPDMLKPDLLEKELEDSVVTAKDDVAEQMDKKSAEKKEDKKGREESESDISVMDEIDIDFGTEDKPVVPRPSSPSKPFKTVIGSDFEGDELVAANGTKEGRISLLGPEQQDDEITDVLVVKHALPVAKMIEEKANLKDIIGALRYKYGLKEERKIAKAVYDGALYYARHELEKENDESKKAKKEDEIKERLKGVGYRRRDIKRVLRETPIMVVRSKARQKKATPWTQKLSERQKRMLKWTGVVAGIATGVVGLMAGTAVLTYKMVMGDATQQKPVKDKQEQVDEQKPEKGQETVEVFMSEIPVTKDAAEEKVEDAVPPTEEKPAEPVKTDEPLVETQPKPVETAEGPKEDEVKVSNGGKTIEKPLVIKEEGKGKGGATDDLEDILGGM